MLCRRSKLTALLCAFVLLVTLLIPSNAAAVTIGVQDTDVSNSASFSTDTIYQIVTDRFFDGDSSNNPTGDIFDITNPRKYHGGDWKGITQKINDGYLTGMGITAIWISSPVENITTIDPSNGSASYHGYWGRDFFTHTLAPYLILLNLSIRRTQITLK